MSGFTHERQRNPHDCALCALAMFMGRSYDAVTARAERICASTEISWKADEPMPMTLLRLVALDYRRAVATVQELPHGVPAILTVASNRADWLHCVFVDECGMVFDPLHGVEPALFEPGRHRFAEVTLAMRDLAPFVLREVAQPVAMAWPEIDVRAMRAHRQLAAG